MIRAWELRGMPELWREDSGYRIYGANTEKAGGIDEIE